MYAVASLENFLGQDINRMLYGLTVLIKGHYFYEKCGADQTYRFHYCVGVYTTINHKFMFESFNNLKEKIAENSVETYYAV